VNVAPGSSIIGSFGVYVTLIRLGGPRGLPGADAGSADARAALVSVVAPSDAGGVIASEDAAVDPVPVSEIPAAVAALDALVPDGPTPATAAGPLVMELGDGVVAATVGVEGAVTASAGLVVIGAVRVTTVAGLAVVVVVVVVVLDEPLSATGAVTGCTTVVVVVTVLVVVDG
jgi:hypothetical protein